MRIRRPLVATVAGALAGVAVAQVAPYVDPPFRDQCVVRHFDEGEAPPLDIPDDPLCVEYEKAITSILPEDGSPARPPP